MDQNCNTSGDETDAKMANDNLDESMRKRADWMKPADDQLLEILRDLGNMTPGAISKDGEVPRADVTSTYAGERLRELARYGLLDRLDRGLFRLSDAGKGYLDEEVDAGELERRDLCESLVTE